MLTGQALQDAMHEMALKVFSPEEFRNTPTQPRRAFLGMLERRLKEDKPPPALEELQGLKEMATEHLWHPALSQLSEMSQA